MTEITLHNYEAFLLDHSENALSAEEIVALEAFARLHPELGINLDATLLPKLEAEATPVDFKMSLKKEPGDLPDEALLAYLEGTLPTKEKEAFDKKLENDHELAKDLDLYKKTILQPDPALALESKASLLKTEDGLLLNNRLICFTESQLSASEKAELEQELKLSPDLQQELDLFLRTRLIADANLIYPDKEELKKEAKIVALFPLRRFAYVAAALMLLTGLAVVFTVFTSKYRVQEEFTVSHTMPQKQAAVPSPEKNLSSASKSLAAAVVNPVTSPARHSVHLQAAVVKKDSIIPASSSLAQAAANSQQQAEATEAIAPKHSEIVSPDVIAEHKNASALSADSSEKINAAGLVHQAVLATVEDTDDEPLSQRKGFWKKAVEVAKHANKLGIKSVDGEEKSSHGYFLSFNSFSVEKK